MVTLAHWDQIHTRGAPWYRGDTLKVWGQCPQDSEINTVMRLEENNIFLSIFEAHAYGHPGALTSNSPQRCLMTP